MVRLLAERSPGVKARVVPFAALLAELGGEEAERIFDRLSNPTTAETAWSHELEREAAELGKGESDLEREPPHLLQRRSGVERRGGGERRQASAAGLTGKVTRSVERRVSGEPPSGVDPPRQQPLPVAPPAQATPPQSKKKPPPRRGLFREA